MIKRVDNALELKCDFDKNTVVGEKKSSPDIENKEKDNRKKENYTNCSSDQTFPPLHRLPWKLQRCCQGNSGHIPLAPLHKKQIPSRKYYLVWYRFPVHCSFCEQLGSKGGDPFAFVI